jgi:hypothetical protein
LKHLFKSPWVKVNVELSSGSSVSSASGATHDDNLFEFSKYIWEGSQEKAEIGERSSVGPDDFIGLGHDHFMNEFKGFFFNRFLG